MSESSGLLSPPPRKQSLASSSDGPFSPGSRRPSHASINGHGGITSRKLSVVSSFVPLDRTDEGEVDPEDLFVRHTIAEVRAVQRKLKAEADSKQEELRLMVGERYRDLLQASASIISMDESSQHVLDELDEMQSIVNDDSGSQHLKRSVASQKDDVELRALQSLTAHIKLLMDAPEHLWRLLEKKKYLECAWLFLLARVVHRSLANDEGDEEGIWQDQNMDILEQFPIAQRQWDAISHFRPQISHKATLFLRDTTLQAEDICATLLALHLVDSKPLTEALSVFIEQRSKALQQAVTRKPEPLRTLEASAAPTIASAQEKARRKAQTRAVRDAIGGVLEALTSTVTTARDVFQERPPLNDSMIHRSLKFVEQDEEYPNAAEVPDRLQLSTRRFLAKLPSSFHFQHLPPAVRAYKPYIDLSSNSTTVKPADLSKRLTGWFPDAVQQFRGAVQAWLAEISSVRDVWRLLLWVRSLVGSSTLLEEERGQIVAVMDALSRTRIVAIWTTLLKVMEKDFQIALQSALGELAALEDDMSEPEDLQQLFHTLPILEAAGTTVTATGFQQYHDRLQSLLVGRTSSLDTILSPLESRARRIRMDIERMRHDQQGAQSLVDDLLQVYEPESASTRAEIISTLTTLVKSLVQGPSARRAPQLILLARLVEVLSSTSDFATNISAGSPRTEEFKQEALTLYTRIMNTWRQDVVMKVVVDYRESLILESAAHTLFRTEESGLLSSQPSAALVEALLVLSTAAQRLGAPTDLSGRASAVIQMLRLLVDELLRKESNFTPDEAQFLGDLRFIRHLTSLWGDKFGSSRAALDERVLVDGPDDAPDHLARMQLLLDPLLPPLLADGQGPSTLLRLGIPPAEQQHVQAALDVVKPSQRFGLLLVGNVAP